MVPVDLNIAAGAVVKAIDGTTQNAWAGDYQVGNGFATAFTITVDYICGMCVWVCGCVWVYMFWKE
jgi:hypothetical protein